MGLTDGRPITGGGIPIFKYDENNKYHRFVKNAVIVVISLAIFVMVWWIISIVADTRVLPSPLKTYDALVDYFDNGYLGVSAWQYMWNSLKLFIEGFLLALVLAVPLGLVLGFSKTLNTFVTPVIEVLRPIAPMAWAPIFIYGISYNTGPMLVVFIGIFFPLLTNIVFGIKKIDPLLLDAARTLGASKLQLFSKIMLPSAIPYVMNGIRIGLGIGWMCIIAAEMYAPFANGVGYCIKDMVSNGLWDSTFAVLVVVAALGILTTTLSEWVSKVVSKRMGVERCLSRTQGGTGWRTPRRSGPGRRRSSSISSPRSTTTTMSRPSP